MLKNVKYGISRPLGSREIQKTKVANVLRDTLQSGINAAKAVFLVYQPEYVLNMMLQIPFPPGYRIEVKYYYKYHLYTIKNNYNSSVLATLRLVYLTLALTGRGGLPISLITLFFALEIYIFLLFNRPRQILVIFFKIVQGSAPIRAP